ncbi:hypothetical protein SAMN05428961_103454 [Paenibacillus sp. OK060]|uniref:hypothetical protein n=1 Tax=Paenibacillus sp. OK060 TaxID=1881034 RepID=UPI00087FB46A|nr:hypothetical protein [Paenibacillus sp. OK060]SDK98005.1 hypothetical protein SAMN05428961_103454 [Paenibacillus sp. OK060]
MIGFRNRALLLIGFSGACRRSELFYFDVKEIQITAEGMNMRVRRSKKDQEGQGQYIGIPYSSRLETCPVRAAYRLSEIMEQHPNSSQKEWAKLVGVSQGRVSQIIKGMNS